MTAIAARRFQILNPSEAASHPRILFGWHNFFFKVIFTYLIMEMPN